MQTKEFYHTLEQYNRIGLEAFVDHIQDYFAGDRTIPVSKTSSISGNDITFTFSDELLRRFQQERNSLEKPYESAIKYGFRGHSKGKQNGIFYQSNRDRRMMDATDRIIDASNSQVFQDLDVTEEGLDSLRKVKIVWHNPSGERVVGAYNTQNNRMLFLDFVAY